MTAIVIFFALTILAYAWWSERNIRKLKKRAIRVDADINTLNSHTQQLNVWVNECKLRLKRLESKQKGLVRRRNITDTDQLG